MSYHYLHVRVWTERVWFKLADLASKFTMFGMFCSWNQPLLPAHEMQMKALGPNSGGWRKTKNSFAREWAMWLWAAVRSLVGSHFGTSLDDFCSWQVGNAKKMNLRVCVGMYIGSMLEVASSRAVFKQHVNDCMDIHQSGGRWYGERKLSSLAVV